MRQRILSSMKLNYFLFRHFVLGVFQMFCTFIKMMCMLSNIFNFHVCWSLKLFHQFIVRHGLVFQQNFQITFFQVIFFKHHCISWWWMLYQIVAGLENLESKNWNEWIKAQMLMFWIKPLFKYHFYSFRNKWIITHNILVSGHLLAKFGMIRKIFFLTFDTAIMSCFTFWAFF